MKPSRDYNGISILRRYFAQLHLLRARFPTETIGHLPIDFVWYAPLLRTFMQEYHHLFLILFSDYRKDIFTNAEYIQEGLQIEQASVLFNICECKNGYKLENLFPYIADSSNDSISV